MRGSRRQRRDYRHSRIRKKVHGTPERPRFCVFRSNRHLVASLIDDENGETLLTLSTSARSFSSGEQRETKTQMAARLGTAVAELAREKGIEEVVFDRGGYRYHGRVRAVAEKAREGGLRF